MNVTGAETRDLSSKALPYGRNLRHFFMKRAPVGEVDDLVQEVMLRIHQRRDPPHVHNVEGYVYQVASSVLHDNRRRGVVRMRSAHCELTDTLHPVEEVSPERVLQARQDVRRVFAELEAMPPRTRHILMLVRFEGMSYAVVAEHMGISVSAVEKHIMRAMRRLKECLHNADGEKPGGTQI